MTEELLRQLLASAYSTLFVSTRELCSNCRDGYDGDEEEPEEDEDEEIEESDAYAMFHDPGRVN